MTEFFTTSNRTPALTKNRFSWIPLLILALGCNAAIWSLAIYYIKANPPSYTSKWTLSLPGTGLSTNVNLPNIGSATSSVNSSYDSSTRDPRENYKFIAESESVLKAAAAQLNIPPTKLGKPRIKVIANSTLINFEIEGESAEKAQNKARSLYGAFQARLNELRLQEVAQRRANIESALASAQKKLEWSQRRVSEYKVRSGLASDIQIEQLATNIEQLRKQRAEMVAQLEQSSARLQQLSTNLDSLTAPQASDGFTLKADQLFQQYLKDYNATKANLVALTSKFLSDHPSVVREQTKLNSVKAALQERSRFLLGRSVDEATLSQLNIGGNEQSEASRATLFKDLVTNQVDRQGLEANVRALDQQISQLEAQLKTLAQYRSTLDGLKRNLQIDETVFSSTLASLDLGKAEIFGTYPQVQLLAEPNLPEKPSKLKQQFVLLGTALGSLFLTAGFILIGTSDRWLPKRKAVQSERIDMMPPESSPLEPESRANLWNSSKT